MAQFGLHRFMIMICRLDVTPEKQIPYQSDVDWRSMEIREAGSTDIKHTHHMNKQGFQKKTFT